jgi:tetratricopeptide (TPR) repeat protein
MRNRLVVNTILLGMLLNFTGSAVAQKQSPPTSRLDYTTRSAPPLSDQVKQRMEQQLEAARLTLKDNPTDPEATIWVGRRLAYLGRFVEAIAVFSDGIRDFPRDARFYRHRGHRYITLRKFDAAIKDLRHASSLTRGKADEIEPDGQPNSRNIPTSTLQFNIWYHLGLAYYLSGDLGAALSAYQECLKVSRNPDALVATSHWHYMTLRLLHRNQEADRVLLPVKEEMEIIENDGYYQLLLMYKGVVSPHSLLEQAVKQGNSPGAHSILYGLGNWYRYSGQTDRAKEIFRQILANEQWTSFGYIAAESDLQRME